MKYSKLVFIGRLQPFHFGQASCIDKALSMAEEVIVLIGSANAARSYRNPFSYEERREVVLEWLRETHPDDVNRVKILPLFDHTYNDQAWIAEVQHLVDSVSNRGDRIGLIGHSKDHSSYYLKLFPQWGSVNVPAFTDRRLFNSTDVREVFFGERSDIATEWSELMEGIPGATWRFLNEFHQTKEYERLRGEHRYIEQYKVDHAYSNAGYDVTFNCVDGVFTQSGHILVVERGTHPGMGLMALPGGFINPNERLLEGMIREVREETGLKVPIPVIEGSVKRMHVFDDPHRSARGRIFSHAFHVELRAMEKLPDVRGGSDASKAWWEPLSRLDPTKMFEDHYHIVKYLTGIA